MLGVSAMQACTNSGVQHTKKCAPSNVPSSKRGVCAQHHLVRRQHGAAPQTRRGASHSILRCRARSSAFGGFATVHVTLLLLFHPATAMVNSDGAKRLLLREARLRGASSARNAFAATAAAAADSAALHPSRVGSTGVEKFSSLPFQLAALIAAEERHELPISTFCHEMDADLEELAGRVLTRCRLGAALSLPLSSEPVGQNQTEDGAKHGNTGEGTDDRGAGDGANLAAGDSAFYPDVSAGADAGAGAGADDEDEDEDDEDDDHADADADADVIAARLMATALSRTIFGVTDASDDRYADVSFFRGCDQAEYYDPRNSFVDRVLSRRRGIPISLALLYAEIGARCSMPFVGLNAPGHLLLAPACAPRAFAVDCFGGGELLFGAALWRFVGSRSGQPPSATATVLDRISSSPMRPLDWAARILRNLRPIYAGCGDAVRLLGVAERSLIISRADPTCLSRQEVFACERDVALAILSLADETRASEAHALLQHSLEEDASIGARQRAQLTHVLSTPWLQERL